MGHDRMTEFRPTAFTMPPCSSEHASRRASPSDEPDWPRDRPTKLVVMINEGRSPCHSPGQAVKKLAAVANQHSLPMSHLGPSIRSLFLRSACALVRFSRSRSVLDLSLPRRLRAWRVGRPSPQRLRHGRSPALAGQERRKKPRMTIGRSGEQRANGIKV